MKEIALILCGIIALPLLAQFLRAWVHDGLKYALKITARKFVAIAIILAAMLIAIYFISK